MTIHSQVNMTKICVQQEIPHVKSVRNGYQVVLDYLMVTIQYHNTNGSTDITLVIKIEHCFQFTLAQHLKYITL